VAYHLSKQAESDLVSIWEYTFHKWSKNQADRYLALLFDEMQYISENPTTGRDKNDIRTNYRCTQMKSHLIFYKQKDFASIEIIRILHQRVDIDSHL
jgi:toxin ParE1/3/4